MKKKLVVIVSALAACLCAFGFAACDQEKAPAHTHDYSSAKYDGSEHWEECECGEKRNVVAHSYVAAKDETSHWEECECGAKQGSAVHAYEGWKKNDHEHWEECSCGAQQNITVHTYEQNEEYHWIENCPCGYLLGKVAHVYNDENICEQCEWIKKSTGLTYTLSSDCGYYICTGLGECQDANVAIANTYQSLPVKEIAEGAFSNSYHLLRIQIPENVEKIGDRAFYGCWDLKNITVAKNNAAYQSIDGGLYTKDGTKLLTYAHDRTETTLVLPEGVQTIGEYAFYDCSTLTAVKLPKGLRTIGEYAFNGCRGLTEITIPDSVQTIGNDAFEECGGLKVVNIGESSQLTTLGVRTFMDCSSLTTITIPGGIQMIDSDVFYRCTSLETIAIPDGVQKIEPSAFAECSNLTDVVFGENSQLISIGSGAFSGCSRLSEFVIPDSVQEIGRSAFGGCQDLLQTVDGISYVHNWAIACENTVVYASLRAGTKGVADQTFYGRNILQEVVVPNSVQTIGNSAFEGCSITSVSFEDDSQLTTIGSQAFHTCTHLTELDFGANSKLISIGKNAFFSCSSLTAITLPEGVQSIADFAFAGCSGLTKLVIPDRVQTIGMSAFQTCSGLTSVVFGENSQLATLSSEAFMGCYKLSSVVIPQGVRLSSMAFYDCDNLTTVYYLGTLSQWYEGIYNSLELKTRYYYSAQEPTEEGDYWHYVDGEPTPWANR